MTSRGFVLADPRYHQYLGLLRPRLARPPSAPGARPPAGYGLKGEITAPITAPAAAPPSPA
jgi:hypothetical protein